MIRRICLIALALQGCLLVALLALCGHGLATHTYYPASPMPAPPSLAYAEDHLNYMWDKFDREYYATVNGDRVVTASFEIEQMWGVDRAFVNQRNCMNQDGSPACGILWIRGSHPIEGGDGPRCPTGVTGLEAK